VVGRLKKVNKMDEHLLPGRFGDDTSETTL